MADWVTFAYREFYDVPRMLLLTYKGMVLLLDSPFDDELDDYRPTYSVYLMAATQESNPSGSWRSLPNKATRLLGQVPVKHVRFDSTRRKSMDAAILDPLLQPS